MRVSNTSSSLASLFVNPSNCCLTTPLAFIVSRQDPVMQVDAVEEELPVELEDACSDDGKIVKHSWTCTDILILLKPLSYIGQFAATPDFSCALLSLDDSDCSVSSTASVFLQSG